MNCPYCGEEILATAKKCKHCGEWLDKEKSIEDAPYDDNASMSKSIPWKTILTSIGTILVGLLLILGKNSRIIGRFFGMHSSVNVTDSHIIGKWKGEAEITKEEDGVVITVNFAPSPEYFADHTEVDHGTITYTLSIDNDDLENEFVFTISYDYRGTWELENSNTLVSVGEDVQMKATYQGAKYKIDPLEESQIVQNLNEMSEELKKSLLEKSSSRIIQYSNNKMVLSEGEDGEEIETTYTR